MKLLETLNSSIFKSTLPSQPNPSPLEPHKKQAPTTEGVPHASDAANKIALPPLDKKSRSFSDAPGLPELPNRRKSILDHTPQNAESDYELAPPHQERGRLKSIRGITKHRDHSNDPLENDIQEHSFHGGISSDMIPNRTHLDPIPAPSPLKGDKSNQNFNKLRAENSDDNVTLRTRRNSHDSTEMVRTLGRAKTIKNDVVPVSIGVRLSGDAEVVTGPLRRNTARKGSMRNQSISSGDNSFDSTILHNEQLAKTMHKMSLTTEKQLVKNLADVLEMHGNLNYEEKRKLLMSRREEKLAKKSFSEAQPHVRRTSALVTRIDAEVSTDELEIDLNQSDDGIESKPAPFQRQRSSSISNERPRRGSLMSQEDFKSSRRGSLINQGDFKSSRRGSETATTSFLTAEQLLIRGEKIANSHFLESGEINTPAKRWKIAFASTVLGIRLAAEYKQISFRSQQAQRSAVLDSNSFQYMLKILQPVYDDALAKKVSSCRFFVIILSEYNSINNLFYLCL